jgi:hypothetical protein
MDLRWGFNNIRIREGDEHKAAFITPMGLFQLNIMQFGLCNAPSTFQRMVDKVLAQEQNSGHVEVYVNNILIHSKDVETNRYWTERVLSKLEEYRLYCREEKCHFEKEEVEFLGVPLKEGAVKISLSKVDAILQEKLPTTRKGVCHFLGLTNYHQKFIRRYSTIA